MSRPRPQRTCSFHTSHLARTNQPGGPHTRIRQEAEPPSSQTDNLHTTSRSTTRNDQIRTQRIRQIVRTRRNDRIRMSRTQYSHSSRSISNPRRMSHKTSNDSSTQTYRLRNPNKPPIRSRHCTSRQDNQCMPCFADSTRFVCRGRRSHIRSRHSTTRVDRLDSRRT